MSRLPIISAGRAFLSSRLKKTANSSYNDTWFDTFVFGKGAV